MQVLTQLFDPIMVFRRLVGLGRELVQNLLNLIGQPMGLFDFHLANSWLKTCLNPFDPKPGHKFLSLKPKLKITRYLLCSVV